jgi:DNA processing protein
MGELVVAAFGSTGPRRYRGDRRLARQQTAPTGPHCRGLPEEQRLWRRIWCAGPGIGWLRLQLLEQSCGGLAQAWQADAEILRSRMARPSRLGERGLEALLAYRDALGSAPLSAPPSRAERQRWRGERVLLCGDGSLPASLQSLERPPLELHWQGRGSLWPRLRQRQAVAVVGTRRPSRQAESLARTLGRALAQAGWPVVSGLAEGIDAAAHRGCLEAGGRPVGILGTPLERVYPRHHEALQELVGRDGLLVSELAPGTPVRSGHFAQRNRLQVAFSCAVVLVECPHGSGALHSARLAWEQGIPLWVVPADVDRVSAAGSNRWLARGASALLDPADLINSLGPGPLRCSHPEASRSGDSTQVANPMQPLSHHDDRAHRLPSALRLEQREAALLAAIGAGASLEQLCQRLRLAPQVLSSRLLSLELAGLVVAEPGLWWRPC